MPVFIKGDSFGWYEESIAVYLKDECIGEFREELVEYICVHKEIK